MGLQIPCGENRFAQSHPQLLAAWRGRSTGQGLRDQYGRRHLLIVAEMPTPAALESIGLHELRLQLVINFDIPKRWPMYVPRQVLGFAQYRSLLAARGMTVTLFSGGKPDEARLKRFEEQTSCTLPAMVRALRLCLCWRTSGSHCVLAGSRRMRTSEWASS